MSGGTPRTNNLANDSSATAPNCHLHTTDKAVVVAPPDLLPSTSPPVEQDATAAYQCRSLWLIMNELLKTLCQCHTIHIVQSLVLIVVFLILYVSVLPSHCLVSSLL